MASPQVAAQRFDNLGSWHHAISCGVDAAAWFDQGLRLVYAFNHDESIRSFEEAARIEPDCAMAWWGVAYANGPHINNPGLDAEHAKAAWAAIERARAARQATPVEREWIAALAPRYAVDPAAKREPLDQAYADAMRQLAAHHPEDSDALALFGEAAMDLHHPSEMWHLDGTPGEGTPELVAALEAALALAPDNPGANHFYIHAMESSKQADKAVASAERLPGLVPGAGHLVHMPAHVYMRIGRYEDAAEANRRAIRVDAEYLKRQPQQSFYLMYKGHNFYFLWAAAMAEGRSAEALQAARDTLTSVPPAMIEAMGDTFILVPIVWIAQARFGRWDELLAEPAPSAKLPSAVTLWHYLRGTAFARTNRLAEAETERAAVAAAVAATGDQATLGNNSRKRVFDIADHMLAGEIAAARQQTDVAVRALEEAVRIEDELAYAEPGDWPLPARHTLGAVLLAAGRPADAERVYLADLQRHPETGWSLRGLSEALRAQRRPAEADAVMKRFAKAWAHADLAISSSRL